VQFLFYTNSDLTFILSRTTSINVLRARSKLITFLNNTWYYYTNNLRVQYYLLDDCRRKYVVYHMCRDTNISAWMCINRKTRTNCIPFVLWEYFVIAFVVSVYLPSNTTKSKTVKFRLNLEFDRLLSNFQTIRHNLCSILHSYNYINLFEIYFI